MAFHTVLILVIDILIMSAADERKYSTSANLSSKNNINEP